MTGLLVARCTLCQYRTRCSARAIAESGTSHGRRTRGDARRVTRPGLLAGSTLPVGQYRASRSSIRYVSTRHRVARSSHVSTGHRVARTGHRVAAYARSVPGIA
eukprot:3656600-Rhodomonas_salina.4